MGMGFAPTWLRQVSPLLHMTTLTIGGLGERRELPQPRVLGTANRKRLFSTFRVSQNALDEKKMLYFCLIW